MTTGSGAGGDEALVEPEGMGASLAAFVMFLVALWLSALIYAAHP